MLLQASHLLVASHKKRMAPFRFHSIQRVVSHKILLIIRYAFTRTIKKCQKTAMLLHGISDTSYNLRQRMPPDMASHAGIHTVSSMIYALHISLLTAGMHKNQSQRNLSTISCRLSTHSYNIYFSLFYSFKKFFKYLSVFVSLLFKMVWEVFHLSFPFVL